MIATHNIKVNGRWFKAGEEIDEVAVTEQAEEQEAQTEEVRDEKPKTDSKPRTTASRRKRIND